MRHAIDSNADTLFLCPSDRAARAWRRQLTRQGLAFRDCVAIESWLEALWQRAALFGALPDPATLLPAAAECALWRRLATEHGALLDVEGERAAQFMIEAWRLALRYGLPQTSLSGARHVSGDDNVAWFADLRMRAGNWLREHGAVTRAELPLRLASHISALRPLLPARIRLTPGFARDPALDQFWQRVAASGIDIAPILLSMPSSQPVRVGRTADTEADREHAIEWACATLSAHDDDDVALVVPALAAERDVWLRALRQRMNDAWWLAPETDGDVFNLSLGASLAAQPVVRALLVVLAASVRPVAVELLAQALTHPRFAQDAAVVARVHRHLGRLLDAGVAESMLDAWPLAADTQAALRQLMAERSRSRRRAEHRRTVHGVVDALTNAPLIARSHLFQLNEAWVELEQAFVRLDRWFPALDWAAAVDELTRLAEGTTFQPESGRARLHVIGLLESAGVPLAHARLVGLSDAVLPEAFAPNPLLPLGWQAANGVGLGSRREILARAQRLIEQWQALVGQLSISCPLANDDGAVSVSPLVRDWPSEHARRSEPAARVPLPLTRVIDETLPVEAAAVAEVQVSPSRLRDQAQCPRRAAAQRLGLAAWPALEGGIPPLLRGNIVHAALAAYGEARIAGDDATAAALARLDAELDAARRVRPEVTEVVWTNERTRIAALLDRVVEFDAQSRANDIVLAVERTTSGRLSGQCVGGKLDRIDDDGLRRVIVDYKTGTVRAADWRMLDTGRLADPQLPLYALLQPTDDGASPVRAVAWYVINDDGVKYVAAGDDPSINPKKTTDGGADLSQWDDTLSRWQSAIAVLVDEWQHGVADVAPIQGVATCRVCEFAAFCREPWSLSDASDDAEEEGDGDGGEVPDE